jgi:serine/threonine protein phosphatase 1
MENKEYIGVIGDIHGCIKTLQLVYKKLKNETDEVYTVGDLIDRGPSSKSVIQYCIDKDIKLTKGNHEDLLINAISHPNKHNIVLHYRNGGNKTAKSYINKTDIDDYLKYFGEVKSLGHYDFLKHLPLTYEFPKVVISHAGIIEGGDRETILWNKNISPQKLDKLQIIGHTPFRSYLYYEDYYINIDTGCVYDNKLTGIVVDIHTGKIIKFFDEYCKD